MNLRDLLEQFYDHSIFARRMTPKVLYNYKIYFARFIKFLETNFYPVDLTSLNPKIIEKFLMTLTRENLSTWSVINYRKGIGRLCSYLTNQGILNINPIEKVAKPRLPKTLPQFLTIQQVKQMMNSIRSNKQKLMLATILFTGVRIGELSNLKLEDFNFDENTIKVFSKGRERIIYYPEIFRNILYTYLEETNKKTGSLFGLTREGMTTLFGRMKRSGIIPVSAHKLRHTYATLMIQGGADLRSVQEMMGHSDIRTTSIYLHCASEQLKEASKKHPLSF